MDADLLPYKKALMDNTSLFDALYEHWKAGVHPRILPIQLPLPQHPESTNIDYANILQRFTQQFRFELADIQYLGHLRSPEGLPRYPESFINYLQRIKFKFEQTTQPPYIKQLYT